MKWNPEIYDSDNYLVLDFETIAHEGGYGSPLDARSRLALAVWNYPTSKMQVHWGDEFSHARLLGDIASCDYIVAHNAKYELGWLLRCGMDLKSIVVFDTFLAEYVLLGNLAAADRETGLPGVSLSLDSCCKRYGLKRKDPIVDIYLKHGITVDQIPQRWVEDRCKNDVISTHKLFLQQRSSLSATNRRNVLYTRCLLTPVLAEIEPNGMQLDSGRVNQTHQQYSSDLSRLSSSMEAITGGINWRSGKQVATYLYGSEGLGFSEIKRRDGSPIRTTTGKPKTDNATLSKLSVQTPEQRQFVEIRNSISKVGSALSKNLDYFKGVCDEQNGIFMAEFNQTRTATHRLSSSGIPSKNGTVQFQNLPRSFKSLFKSRHPGWKIAEVDGSQLEFRVAAFLGQDRQAMDDILNPGFDAHIASGAAMAQRDYGELYAAYKAGDKKAKEIRQQAKAETFKPLYGGSKGTKAQERWYKAFKERYSTLCGVQDGWVSHVLQSKELITPWGLRYYWPRASINNQGYVNVKASVYNYPVQALATAEIIPIAIRCLRDRILANGLGSSIVLVNTVHDSVVCEIAPEAIDKFKEMAIIAFTTDVYEYLDKVYGMKFNVPLGTSIKIGDHWGEAEEENWNVFQDGKQVRIT